MEIISQASSPALQHFKQLVGIKFQLYNSLFTSLPFHRIEKTGILLSLFNSICDEGYKKKQGPTDLINEFFLRHTTYSREEEQTDLLFRFVQYIERQVVLFDALEDAAFTAVQDMGGAGTLKQLETEVLQAGKQLAAQDKLTNFGIRLVLTAHPTQFYPGPVLGIINDLSKSLKDNNLSQINSYLQQLGKTPFFKKQKPTPFDEATSLIWYLENVFYAASGRIINFLKQQFTDDTTAKKPVIRMGFWPGGDRDGNPFVTASITRKVGDALRGSIIKCYYMDIRRLRRRLTFKGVENLLQALEIKLYNNLFIPDHQADITAAEILATLYNVREILIYQHNGLFLSLLNGLINKLELFGLYFASLDIRQDSSVHQDVMESFIDGYGHLSDVEKLEKLQEVRSRKVAVPEIPAVQEAIETISSIQYIQQYNGEEGCNRYIISQCKTAVHVMEVFTLFSIAGLQMDQVHVDVIPLFETIEDLVNADEVMRLLYTDEMYQAHVKKRGNVQTIMLGFSDGTKDGGYLMANWSIYQAKIALTQVSKLHGVDVVFFDGRGGPPARGGGKTHKFYSSLGNKIANNEIQLTIQGQTVSSNFGTVDAAQFNIEQLLHAGISNDLFTEKNIPLADHDVELIDSMAKKSFEKYVDLKNHPRFMEYLTQVSPLRLYAETNIGSRPAKRGGGHLTLKDLRAIPYVGAWSQLKQNVTGYFGVGTALKHLEETGKWDAVSKLYKQSLFFKTLLDNCEMAMHKCYFPLTAYLADHPVYGEMWEVIYDEYALTKKYILQLSGKNELMSDYPVEQLSIQMRERIVLPLLTIQQYAISKIREGEEQLVHSPFRAVFEKLAMRCSFGIINAGRNSA